MHKLDRLAGDLEAMLNRSGFAHVQVNPSSVTQLGGSAQPLHRFDGVEVMVVDLVTRWRWYADIDVSADDLLPLVIEWLASHDIEPTQTRTT